MANKIILIGRLTEDVEIIEREGKKPIGTFTLAVKRNYKNSQGGYDADFVDIKARGENAKNAKKYIGKGVKVYVEGKLKTGSYEDKQGIRRKFAEVDAEFIEYLEKKKEND